MSQKPSQSSYRFVRKPHGAVFLGCGRLQKTKSAEPFLRYNFFTLILITQGEGFYVNHQGEKTLLKAGNFVLRNIGEKHRIIITSNHWQEYFLAFKSMDIDQEIPANFARDENTDWLLPNAMESPLGGLHDKTESLIDGLGVLDRSRSVGLCQDIPGLLPDWNQMINTLRDSPTPMNLQISLLELMKRTTAQAIKAESLEEKAARLLRIHALSREPLEKILQHLASYSHLRSRFTQHWGMSPGEFRIRARMDQAITLLRKDGASVKNTAYALNYKDPSAFSKQFKEVCGISPSEFQNQTFEKRSDALDSTQGA
ncbi:MAG: AraC family transcriptional regulator [Spirochaetales bacterium]|nr:AraC family transcriptional regulator [Spirochaetales bacterium]